MSDMTEEEAWEIGDNNKAYFAAFIIDKLYTPTEFLLLLKSGFDLFGLIESNQAIDKTTLTP